MRSRSVFAAAVVLSLSTGLFGDEAPVNGNDDIAKLARSSNAFGFDLYQRLRGKPGNLVISPASVTTALTMPWGG
jgi:serine protease inhibitor